MRVWGAALRRHREIRELIERAYPHCRVTEITEQTRTTFKRKFDTLDDYMLASLDVSYAVETASAAIGQPAITCRVGVDRDGSLHVYDVQYILYW